ncbi:alpha/beta fold hydrolase [Streptomyces sp. NPDC088387]|uniref:alpha/beta fold hydrolase n=1 Tax=Streptomyces sp. NPDC088387 TaxID=3365859 RepID=UPI0037FA2348
MAGAAGPISVLCKGLESPGTPLVLIHGINGAASQWTGVIDLVADRPILAIDLRGHGDSAGAADRRPGDYGAEAYARDVAAVLDHFALSRAHLAGASFGGGVAVTVAAQRPELPRSVTVIGGALSVAGHADIDALLGELNRRGPVAFFELVASASFAPGTAETLLRDSARLAARNDVETVEAILRDAFTADVSAAAAAVGVAALVLTGEHDRTCPPELGAALALALHGRHSVLPDRGHMAHLEDPGLIARLLDRHLTDVERRPYPIGG